MFLTRLKLCVFRVQTLLYLAVCHTVLIGLALIPAIVEHTAAANVCTVPSRAGTYHAAVSMTRLPLTEATKVNYVDECSHKSAVIRNRAQHSPCYCKNKVGACRCMREALFLSAQMVKEGLVEPSLFLLAVMLGASASLSICLGSVEFPACHTSEAVISRLGL